MGKTKNGHSQMSSFIQVMIACVIINLANGSAYVWSVYGQNLINEGGWSAFMASLPYTVNVVVSSFSSLLGGWICDQFQPRVSALIGGVCFFIGWFVSGSTSNPWLIIICYGLFCGCAQGMVPNATTSTAGKWAPEGYKGLATGISHSANGFSSIYMAPLGAVLLSMGRTRAFHTMAFIALCLVVVGSIFLRKPEFSISVSKGNSNPKNTIKFFDAIKMPAYWLLFLINAIGLIGGGVVFSQCAMIAQVQAGWKGGYILVMILALSNGGGRIFCNGISDRIGIYKTFTIMFAVAAVNFALFSFYHSVPLLIVGIILTGITFGGLNSMLYSAAAFEFGSQNLGRIQGSLAIGYLFQGLFGATLAGSVLDKYGNYSVAFVFSAVCMIIVLVLTQILRKDHEKRYRSA